MQELEKKQNEVQNIEENNAQVHSDIVGEQPLSEQINILPESNSEELSTLNELIPQSQSEQQPPQKPKKKKKWIIIITAIVLAAAIGVGGWYAYPSIKSFVNEIIDEYKYPRMKFSSEQEMKDFLIGTWRVSKKYNSKTDEWENKVDVSDVYDTIVFREQRYFTLSDSQPIYELFYLNCNIGLSHGDESKYEDEADEFFEKYPDFSRFRRAVNDAITSNGLHKYSFHQNFFNYSKSEAGIYHVLETGELMFFYKSEDSNPSTGEIYEKISDEKIWPPEGLEEEYKRIKSLCYTVSEDIITQNMLNLKYTAGIWSMKIGTLLNKLSSDYQVKIEDYEEAKLKINSSELDNYKDYLNTTYLVTVSGSVLYNPDVPNYYSEEQELLSVLLVFNKDSELVTTSLVKDSSDFYSAALLYMNRGY